MTINAPKSPEGQPRSLETRAGTIVYIVTRSARRRTVQISVSNDGMVRVVAPRYALVADITGFIQEKADWIVTKIADAQRTQAKIQKRQYKDGHCFLFLGKTYPLRVEQRAVKRTRIQFDAVSWQVIVPASERDDAAAVKDKLIQWYRQQAEEVLGARLFFYARKMGQEPQKIAVRTQKRVWGNCDFRTKTIHLNWYLILAPLAVIDYVIVHELCHLEVPNHSKRFWQRVEAVMPNYKLYKQWLKTNAVDMILP